MSIEIINGVAVAAAVSSMIGLFLPLAKGWMEKIIQKIRRRQLKVKITLKAVDDNGDPIEITLKRGIRAAPLSEEDIEKILIQARGIRNES